MFDKKHESFWFQILLMGFLVSPFAMLAAVAHPIGRQQLLFQSQQSLPNGVRVGIFLPTVPIALGLQSKSGSRILTIGDLLNCQPFEEQTEIFRKTAAGEFEPVTNHQELLNCGPPAPGEADRILGVVGIQWRQ